MLKIIDWVEKYQVHLKYVGGVEGDTAVTTELDQDHEAEGDQERSEDGAVQQLWRPELLSLPVLLPLPPGVETQQCGGVVVTPQ